MIFKKQESKCTVNSNYVPNCHPELVSGAQLDAESEDAEINSAPGSAGHS